MVGEVQREEEEEEREGSSAGSKGRVKTVLKVIPDIQSVLGTIGHHRCNGDDATLEMKLCHPLLKYLGGIQLTQDKIASMGMADFLCDDGFHPGRFGTIYVGNLIREAYEDLMT